MFEDLRQAFREALDNFQQELNRDRIPGSVDRLLARMGDEVAAAEKQLAEVEAEIERLRGEAEVEAREVATCVRRARLAREIGDEETARIADEYGERHRRRKEVLDQKIEAFAREAELRRTEVREMLERVGEARARRDVLAAETGWPEARATPDLTIDLDAPPARPAVDYDAALAELKRRMGARD